MVKIFAIWAEMPKKVKILVCFTGIALSLMFSFGIYCCVEYARRDAYEKSDYVCGTFGNITSLTMTKELWSIWHWKYSGGTGYFEQRCPTFTHDASIYNNGQLVARTDGKILSLMSKYYIKDCHGNIKYYVEAGDL